MLFVSRPKAKKTGSLYSNPTTTIYYYYYIRPLSLTLRRNIKARAAVTNRKPLLSRTLRHRELLKEGC